MLDSRARLLRAALGFASLEPREPERRAALRERLARAEAIMASRSAQDAQHEAIERQCAQILRGIDRLTLEGRRTLLRTLLDEVIVRGNEVELHGVLPSEKLITTAA